MTIDYRLIFVIFMTKIIEITIANNSQKCPIGYQISNEYDDGWFKCGETNFTTNRCIPIEWQCDNIIDCPDGSDENQCRYVHQCDTGKFLCRNFVCTDYLNRCDNVNDCGDWSDERGCVRPTNINQLCPLDKMYECVDGPCIVVNAVCDRSNDCPQNDDEHCTKHRKFPSKQCHMTYFQCETTEQCIHRSFLCDGMYDCSDRSDEKHCSSNSNAIIYTSMIFVRIVYIYFTLYTIVINI